MFPQGFCERRRRGAVLARQVRDDDRAVTAEPQIKATGAKRLTKLEGALKLALGWRRGLKRPRAPCLDDRLLDPEGLKWRVVAPETVIDVSRAHARVTVLMV